MKVLLLGFLLIIAPVALFAQEFDRSASVEPNQVALVGGVAVVSLILGGILGVRLFGSNANACVDDARADELVERLVTHLQSAGVPPIIMEAIRMSLIAAEKSRERRWFEFESALLSRLMAIPVNTLDDAIWWLEAEALVDPSARAQVLIGLIRSAAFQRIITEERARLEIEPIETPKPSPEDEGSPITAPTPEVGMVGTLNDFVEEAPNGQ